MRRPLLLSRSGAVGIAMIGVLLMDAPASPSARVSLQMELMGIGQGWTDITPDTRASDLPLKWERGIKGTSPLDRVAGIGTCTFGLNNHANNSLQRESAYSPGHANCRRGFQIGAGVRVALIRNTAGVETTVYHWRGRLDVIKPKPGSNQNRLVSCQAVDFIDELARFKLAGIPTQINKRSNELFATLIAAMPRQPAAVEAPEGIDTFPFAFDNIRDGATGLSECQRIALSELALIYPKGDSTSGGTLVCESRRTRGRAAANVQVFDNTMHAMEVSRKRGNIINRAQVITHPRKVGASATVVLAELQSKPAIAAGETLSIRLRYRDPDQTAARVGGTDMQPLVAGTDWAVNSASDGTGTNLTSGCSATASFDGAEVEVAITNNSGLSGYITKIAPRGRPLLDYEPATVQAEDPASQITYGDNVMRLDMQYQSDQVVASGAAQYIVGLYKDDVTNVDRFGFLANASAELLDALFNREISDRIGIRETVTGLTDTIPGSTATRGFFINSIAVTATIGVPPLFHVTYTLAPADQNAYWQLAIPGKTELGATTRLGFGLFAEHVDVAHQDGHDDVLHLDTAHADSHTDVAHQDDAHADSAHSDTAHSDAAHVDTAHADSHTDTAHADVPHSDSHSDVAHYDAHDDVDGIDWHIDTYGDAPHEDAHNDAAHSDTAHQDVAHADSAHVDVPHSDVLHADAGHADAGHADVLHEDVAHADTNHADSPHEDEHQDVNHGDGFI